MKRRCPGGAPDQNDHLILSANGTFPKDTSIHFGFADMPPEVVTALRGGEMRMLQGLAGWKEVRFRHPEGTIEYATGSDGLKYYYDEQGKRCVATRFLDGPLVPEK